MPMARLLPFFALWMLITVLLALSMESRAATDDTLQEASALLVQKFDARAQAVSLLVERNHPRTREILRLLQQGELYYRKRDDRLFVIGNHETGAPAVDLLDGSRIDIGKTRDFKRVTLNNQMRGQISQALAELGLKSEDPQRRASAVRELLGALDDETVAVLRNRIASEPVTEVRDLMTLALAIRDLGQETRRPGCWRSSASRARSNRRCAMR
ncbi:hypothetical protein [Marinobacterium aestuariivivens]|uniref:Urea ABC transporter permease subunit UrtB n=1 Tax=Marinobacterium aestuariivivens TaxID=1698799 RepID=A0ABW2A2V3_9GAMM